MYEENVAPHVRSLNGKCLRATSCLYTVTRDFGFVIDRHPDAERVIIASACSGHGFKHSPAIGEALARLVLEGASGVDPTAFGWQRLRRDHAGSC